MKECVKTYSDPPTYFRGSGSTGFGSGITYWLEALGQIT